MSIAEELFQQRHNRGFDDILEEKCVEVTRFISECDGYRMVNSELYEFEDNSFLRHTLFGFGKRWEVVYS